MADNRHCKVCTGIIITLVLLLSAVFIVSVLSEKNGILGDDQDSSVVVHKKESNNNNTISNNNIMKFSISSPAFEAGKTIPQKFTCDGDDINPEIVFENIPSEAKSLAIIMDDPDAPNGDWVHWVLYNIPANVGKIEENGSMDGVSEGITSFGVAQYGGPCPPKGAPHRYFFKAYALDTLLDIKDVADKKTVLGAMEKHILAESYIMGIYGRT